MLHIMPQFLLASDFRLFSYIFLGIITVVAVALVVATFHATRNNSLATKAIMRGLILAIALTPTQSEGKSGITSVALLDLLVSLGGDYIYGMRALLRLAITAPAAIALVGLTLRAVEKGRAGPSNP